MEEILDAIDVMKKQCMMYLLKICGNEELGKMREKRSLQCNKRPKRDILCENFERELWVPKKFCNVRTVTAAMRR